MIKRLENTELIEALCNAFGPSGCCDNVAELIKEQITGYCDRFYTDRLGNLIAVVGCRDSEAKRRIMLSAHMDEVGVMITGITPDGYLGFSCLGGIDPAVLGGRTVVLGDESNRVAGIITSKAVHHKSREERTEITPVDKMYIDIGAVSRDEALRYADIGTYGTFAPDFLRFGEGERMLCSKALDDRLGCALLIEVMRQIRDFVADKTNEYYFCFTDREETGLSGAKVAAQVISPDSAVVIETTAVADIFGVPENSRVADLGSGGVISLMDRSTIYDRGLIDASLTLAGQKNIPVQIKRYVSGGNDAGHIHKSGVGVRTLALSAPTRYLHSASCVASFTDYLSMKSLLCEMIISDIL